MAVRVDNKIVPAPPEPNQVEQVDVVDEGGSAEATSGSEESQDIGDEDQTSDEVVSKSDKEKPIITSDDLSSQTKEERVGKKGDIVVIVAGRPRKGKSRALNNLFGGKFESRSSPSSVTHVIDYARVVKHGFTIILVDTPGLGAADSPMSQVEQKYFAAVGNLNYTLVYSYSVAPDSMLDNLDEVVFINLQMVLGKGIWKKTVFLFTFSDALREYEYPEVDKREHYLEHLRKHARILTTSLRKCCGNEVPEVKLVLDVDVNDPKLDCIVAVPVGRSLVKGVEEKVLIPTPDGCELDWIDTAMSKIFRKSHPLDQIKLKKIGHRVRTAAGLVVGVCVGAALGGMAGAVIGAAIGGVGAFPGAAAGAITGGVTGGFSSGSMGQIILYPHKKATDKHKKAEKLRSAPLIAGSKRTFLSTPQGQAEIVQSMGFSREDSMSCPPGEEPQVYETLRRSSTTSSSLSEPEIEVPSPEETDN